MTSPNVSSEIGRTLARRSRNDEKNAAAYSSGGRKMTRAEVGLELDARQPREGAQRGPPTTNRIG
jgi:hypothetical protein